MTEYDPADDEIIVTKTVHDFKRLSANPSNAEEEEPEVLLGVAAIGSLYFSGKKISYDRVKALANTTRTVLPEFDQTNEEK